MAINGAVHLYELQNGPAADIDKLGNAFMLNVVASFAIAVALVFWKSIWPVLAGIAISIGSAVPLLISRYSMDVSIDLFDNFEPMWRSEMVITLVAEVVAAIALAAIAVPASTGRRTTET